MSKSKIRPQGAEGISHPRNVAKSSLTVNDSSTPPATFARRTRGKPHSTAGGAA